MTSEHQTIKLVREGDYIAEVDVALIETGHEWSPYLTSDDVRKLDDVRRSLRQGDLKAVQALGGRVYEMKPVAAE
ncbi:MAG: hypothetical protein ABL907_00585 [Hyphomicrobium sp.]